MSVYYADASLMLREGDAVEQLASVPDNAVNCVVTSPPYYGLRDYGVDGQIGLESTPGDYVKRLAEVFREVRRVLAWDGTVWLNIGDSYSTTPTGSRGASSAFSGKIVDAQIGIGLQGDRPRKSMLGIPWRVAFALQDDGWILRNAIIWRKTNGKPESVKDRLSSRYEHVFMFSKQPRYWFDLDAIRVPHAESSKRSQESARVNPNMPGKAANAPGQGEQSGWASGLRELNMNGANPGDVWDIPTQPYPGAHFAPMSLRLASRCVLAGCKPGGIVLDPFCGSGTSLLAALQSGRRGLGIDLNYDYLGLALERCRQLESGG